ncbi:MAG: Mfa1 fimbrilin C-terminal domain-containing protein, partial [Prevotella sp.]|nr:Mfa1 fimbrilin C-terminal domain-containing protein [Prevotella sp.]
NIDSSWASNDDYSTWYKGTENYSSNWCASPSYYKTAGEDGKIEGLTYVSLKENLNEISSNGTTVYCAENTNSSVTSKSSPAITSVLIKAMAYEKSKDADGNDTYTGISLVRYKGMLFTKEAFFNTIILDKGLCSDATGTLLTNDKLMMSDGSITVTEGTEVYKDGTKVEDTSDLFSDITGYYYYDGGLMYYTIPIKHVNTSDEVGIGTYGVVRNYHYVITVNSLSNLGKPISNEEDEIIPSEEETETYYYVPANIKILSWKELTQEENL